MNACSIADGSSVNDGDCACGSTSCNAATGHFCLASSSKCQKIPEIPDCSKKLGSTANSESCSCGSSECDATKGLFCLATSSRCTIFAVARVGTCDGCEDLVGAKSGVVWDDGSRDGCDYYAADEEKNCAFDGANDEGEGAANDKW